MADLGRRLGPSIGNLLFSAFLGVWIHTTAAGSATDGSVERSGEYCETEMFRAACSDSEGILLLRARYGRMRLGRCVEFDLGYIDCYTDVLTRLDKRCSGRRTCQVRIPDAEFEATGPCLKELKTYLEVSYVCVPVEAVSSTRCAASSYINVTLPTGYIGSRPPVDPPVPVGAAQASLDHRMLSSMTPSSSRSSPESSAAALAPIDPVSHSECDHSSKPWVVAASRGQRINLTLYDFAMDEAHVTNAQRTHESGRICRQYGWIDDSAFDRPKPLCAGDRRVTHLESSRGHVVKIWTMSSIRSSSSETLSRFMIKYTVIGCPDPEFVPEQTWFERSVDGNSATMGCVNAEVKWSVFCVNNVWVGYHANCTTTHEKHRDDTLHNVEGASIPYGLAIGVGAIIGVMIALVIVLFIGCNRRDIGRGGSRRPASAAALSADKRSNRHQQMHQHQQQQQLQLRQLEDYTYYEASASAANKPLSMSVYDCPCGVSGGGGGGGGGKSIEMGRNPINDRRHGTKSAGRFHEQLTLPTCDLCVVQHQQQQQQHPSSQFDCDGDGRVPWSSASTYSRLPILVQPPGSVELSCIPLKSHRRQEQQQYVVGGGGRPRMPVVKSTPGTPDAKVDQPTRIGAISELVRSASCTSVTDAGTTVELHAPDLGITPTVRVDRESVMT